MNIVEAWEILRDHLPPDAGYESCELDEMADYIKKYNQAIDTIDALVVNIHSYTTKGE